MARIMTYSQLAKIFLYFLVINLIAFAIFGYDKRRAQSGGWRISENSLLFIAAIGGIFGAFAGRRHFRHKTRKWPFGLHLILIAVFHCGVAAYLLAITAYWVLEL